MKMTKTTQSRMKTKHVAVVEFCSFIFQADFFGN